jgi:hypothetical protein
MKQCHVIDFSSYGISAEASQLLEKIWNQETANASDRPNFAR